MPSPLEDAMDVPLLSDTLEAPKEGDEEEWTASYPTSPRTQRTKRLLLFLLFFLVLLANNAFWLWKGRWKTLQCEKDLTQSYPPVRFIDNPFYQLTEYSAEDEGKAHADQLWKDLFPLGNGVLSLETDEAHSHGLAETAPDPIRPGNGVYIMSGYHSLHCLTVLRGALFHFHLGENQTAPWNHLVHCLDQMRQTMQCNIDTTLLAAKDPDHFIDGQSHRCKDFMALREWMTDHAG
ncbi:hypothetical protein N7510_005380 [Penicillium lagena]|uniref:uncharacterized protein n=1 Tax=Penicillium lagena TaxID=94218 RepID=UPI002540AA6C|nr:uncharacterized protein N7510_005380 [Penicillium lagena]KAJ5612186.1 hypothetical protein N7510_005380 [Penicillium lagena]